MAQLVEHILGKDEVPSSNLGSSSNKNSTPIGVLFLFALLLKFVLPRRKDGQFGFDREVKTIDNRFCKAVHPSMTKTRHTTSKESAEPQTCEGDRRRLCDGCGVAAPIGVLFLFALLPLRARLREHSEAQSSSHSSEHASSSLVSCDALEYRPPGLYLGSGAVTFSKTEKVQKEA